MLRLFKPHPHGSPARPADITGGFGKLGLHTEFIRHQAQSREAVALDRWVSEGVNFMIRKDGADWDGRLANSAGFRFVWTGNDNDRTLSGVLVPSADKSGRPYPFVIFTSTPAPVFREVPSAMAITHESFYARAEAILEERWESQRLSVLSSMLDALVPPDTSASKQAIVNHEMTALESTTTARLWHACGPEFTTADRETFWATLQSILFSVCRRAPGRIPWGIRLPLPSGGNSTPIVLFWVHLIQAMIGDAAMRPHYIWTRSRGAIPPRLTFFFRPLPPSYLLSLLDESVRDGAVYDILTEMRQQPTLPADPAPALTDDRLSLMAFLDMVGPRKASS